MEKLDPNDILSIEVLKPEDILSVEEPEKPKSALQSIGETASDIGRGALSGLTFGGVEELVAGGKALLSDEKESLQDLYRKYLEVEEKKTKEAQERSPVASTVGEVVGALAPALVTGGASMAATGGSTIGRLAGKELAKAAGKAALVEGAFGAAGGALAGGLTSEEGKLIGATPEEREKLLEDIGGGALTGGVLGSAAGGVTPYVKKLGRKVVDWSEGKLDDTIFGKQLREAFEKGESGGGYLTEKQRVARVGEITRGVDEVGDVIHDALDAAGNDISRSIKTADAVGAQVNLPNKEITLLLPSLEEAGEATLARELKSILDSNLDPLTLAPGMGSILSPSQAYNLKTKLKDYTYKDPNLYRKIKPLIESIDEQIESVFEKNEKLKSLVGSGDLSSYKQAMSVYTNLADALPESIIGKGVRSGERGAYYGDRKYKEKVLRDALESLTSHRYLPGDISREAIQTIESPSGGLKAKLDALSKDPQLKSAYDKVAQNIGFKNIEDLKQNVVSKIEDTAVKSSTTKSAVGYDPQGGAFGKDLLSLGRKGGLFGANILGETKRIASVGTKALTENRPSQLAKRLYSLPETSLRGVAEKLQQSPKMGKYAKRLTDALDSGDTVKKDAVLFLLMQNPEFRSAIPELISED